MSITFGGLATGLDTGAIVDQLMELERVPITRMQADKSWFQSREAAYTAFDTALSGFLSNIENLGSSDELRQKSVSTSSDDFLSVTGSVDALPGASYQVEVVSLAQVQKTVSQGYADKTSEVFSPGELFLTVGDDAPISILIDETNNSLEGIMQAINDIDAGVNASIINDGTDAPYRLVLTGENVATTFSLTADMPIQTGDISAELQSGGFPDVDAQIFGSGTVLLSNNQTVNLTNETNSLTDIRDAINAASTNIVASIVADGDNFVLELSNSQSGGSPTILSTVLIDTRDAVFGLEDTQSASKAHIRVDNIDIYSDSNTLDEAIPGLTLDLTSAEAGTMTNVSVSLDEAAIKSQIESFVAGYNSVQSFIGSQSASEGSDAGILGGDSGMNNVKRRLQNMLTSMVSNSGNFSALSQLGLKTQKDGTLEIDDEILTDAIRNNLDSVEKLLVGEDDNGGIAVQFQDYLEGMTSSVDGMLATTTKSTESSIKRIDTRIEIMEMRLDKKEETMLKKFAALEELISGMNSQSSFLTQQLDMLSSMLTRDN